ncbi:MAG: hypothetical protein ACMXYF_05890, partial [Candidatus Woesearchaeota archaeon]
QLRSGSSVQVQCNSVTSIDAYSYPIEVRYTNVQTNTQRTQRGSDLQLVGSASSFECPSGFVPVPGGFVLADGTTVDDFCVMKYEAKNVGGVPVSQPDGIPWLLPNENSKSQAKDLCEQNGYSLLSSRQWMQINENILHTPINNLDSSQPEIFLARGNVDESGAYGAVLDSGTADCDLSVSLDHVNNDDCPLRVEGYVGMSYTWDSVQRDHKRIFVLSNGEVIWDWVGNADNIIEFDVSSVSGPSGGYYYVLYPGDLSNDYCDNFDTGLTEYCYDYILSFFPYLKPSIFNFQNGGAFGGDLVQFDGFGKVGSNHYMYGGFLGVDIFGGFWGSLSDDGFRCTYTP